MRRLTVLLAVWLGLGSVALADEPRESKDACIRAADEGQVYRDRKALLEARERFLACARDECPAIVRKQCAEWEAGVDASLPTVIVSVTRGDRQIADARVLLDGRSFLDKLDGEAVPVDPGPHAMHVEAAGATVDRDVIVREGEKNQAFAFALEAPAVNAAPAAAAPPAAPPGETAATPDASAAPGGLVAPAIELSAMLGAMGWSQFLRGGSPGILIGIELGFAYRWSPMFDLGVFLSGDGGGTQLNGDVAAAASVKDQGGWGFGMLGVRGRVHWLRDQRLDGWLGLEVAGLADSFSFTGTTPDKSFDYVGSGVAAGALVGADFPLSRTWALGLQLRGLVATGPHGSRVQCNANCAGDLPGDAESARGALDIDLRLTWSLP